MINLLSGWQGTVELNGVQFNSIKDIKKLKGKFKMVLRPKKESQQVYRIVVKTYMTRPSTPEFDFMDKWNDDIPMPDTEMYGYETGEETKGMIKMKLWGSMIFNPETEPDWEGWIVKSAILEKEQS